MAGGNNHAKQMVLNEAESLANDLQNGHAGDTEKIGKLLGFMLQMITPMYMHEFVTIEQCLKMHAASDKKRPMSNGSIKLGPLEVKAPVMFLLNQIPTAVLLFVLGKTQNWW